MARKSIKLQRKYYYCFGIKSATAGFLLLEFIVYISCSIILSGLLFNLMLLVYSNLSININRINFVTQAILVSDRITQDILLADASKIKLANQNLFIFNYANQDLFDQNRFPDVSWFIKDLKLNNFKLNRRENIFSKRLIRRAGDFNKAYNLWKHPSQATLSSHLKSLSYEYFFLKNYYPDNNFNNLYIHAIKYDINFGNLVLSNYIALRVGLYL